LKLNLEVKPDRFNALNGFLFILSGSFFNANLLGFGDNPYHRKVEIKLSRKAINDREGWGAI